MRLAALTEGLVAVGEQCRTIVSEDHQSEELPVANRVKTVPVTLELKLASSIEFLDLA